MKKVIILNKKEGETPLQALENFRAKNKKYKEVRMTYAGRLDPMANGLLLVLAGDEVKNKEKYLVLDKEYEFKVLFGFRTDTHDILGKISNVEMGAGISTAELQKKIKKEMKNLIGEMMQKYPAYSSKTVKGKPLFSYAREGEEVEIPEKKIKIKKLNLEKIIKIDNKKLFKNIEKRIQKVSGDFRQKEILDIWRKNLATRNNFFLGKFNIKCSSGTYVRKVADLLGENMGIPALAFSIKRTKIGKWR